MYTLVQPTKGLRIPLPQPSYSGNVPLEKALLQRRTRYDFGATPLSLAEISQLLWAAQGITHPRGFRTAPSAGGLYCLQIHVMCPKAPGIDEGVYVYIPQTHELIKTHQNDKRHEIMGNTIFQPWNVSGSTVFLIAGFEGQIAQKYGSRARRYMYLEAGHAAQNLLLQATAMGFNTGLVGAFRDQEIIDRLALAPGEEPIYLITVGKKE